MKKFDLLKDSYSKIPVNIHKEVDLSFDIVNRIHNILERQGKSQKDLALALGKTESEISKWMRGTHNFTINTIAKISIALGEDIVKIVGTRKNDLLANSFEVKSLKLFYTVKENSQKIIMSNNYFTPSLTLWSQLESKQSRKTLC